MLRVSGFLTAANLVPNVAPKVRLVLRDFSGFQGGNVQTTTVLEPLLETLHVHSLGWC